jgi:hypothetical protein
MEKAAKDVDTIQLFDSEAATGTQQTEKTTRNINKYDIKLATYIAYDDMVKFNNIIAAQSKNKIKIPKQAEVLRNLILEFIEANKHLA